MSIKFQDNLLYPNEAEVIKYKGKEPFRIYREMSGILKDALETSGAKVWERIVKWDLTSPNRSFYVNWEAERGIDGWTKISVYVTAIGNQNSETRMGEVTIKIMATFTTKVSLSSFQKIFWWIYYFIYYKKKRLHDFYMAKNLVNRLKIKIGELYGIKVEESS